MKQILTLATFFLLCSSTHSQAPQWINYVNDGVVTDIHPTDDFLWACTQGGLIRVDRETGQRRIFQLWNSGLRSRDLNSATLAPDGKLWVTGRNVGLSRLDGEDWEQFYIINTGDTLKNVYKLRVASDGKVWFLANNINCQNCLRFFSFNGVEFAAHDAPIDSVMPALAFNFELDIADSIWIYSKNKVFKYFNSEIVNTNIPLLPNEIIETIGFDQNNTLWVSTKNYTTFPNFTPRIRYLTNDAWHEMDANTLGGPVRPSDKMIYGADGNFYIFFYETLYQSTVAFAKFDGSNWEYVNTETFPNHPAFAYSQIKGVTQDGHLWFRGYVNEGLPYVYEFDGSNWEGYNTNIFPLRRNYISDAIADCNNNIWLAGGGLLVKFDGVSWQHYTAEDIGLASEYFSIWSMTLDSTNCDIWISFYDNVDNPVSIAKFDGDSFSLYTTPDETDAFKVALAQSGVAWVASAGEGLGRLEGNNWVWYNQQNSPIEGYIPSVAVAPNQDLWVATQLPYSIIRFNSAGWLKFTESNSPITPQSTWLFIDQAGVLWTGGSQGLLKFNGSQWQSVSIPGNSAASCMAQDQMQNFWICNEAGLHKWDGNTFTSYNFIDDPIGSTYISTIYIDPFGNKWMRYVGSAGITVFNENGISNQNINAPNSARGTIFFDENQNGLQDQTDAEPGLPGEKVKLLPNDITAFTNYGGEYAFFPAPGEHQIDYLENQDYSVTTAPVLPLNMGANEVSGYDFGAWAESPPDSIALDLCPGFMRCGMVSNVWLSLVNYGILQASGDIRLEFDPSLVFLTAHPAPDALQGNTLIWNFEDLYLFEPQQIRVEFLTPGANAVGELLSFNAQGFVIKNGTTTAQAEDNDSGEVRCSYDPNDKLMSATGQHVANYALLSDPLDFTVRFQNTGNDTAFTVIVRDTLDSDLDFSTLQILSSSHPVKATMTASGILTFLFEDINLLWESVDYSGSQGFVKYRIAPKNSLPDPTTIYNTAHIYFDFNPAIITNTTAGILVGSLPTSGGTAPTRPEGLVRLFPNPSSGDFSIQWLDSEPAQTWQMTILDVAGRSCQQGVFEDQKAQIRGLKPGFYLVLAEKNGKVQTQKLVVAQR
jgi:uncharacterized repeat protein (TIGR01451 family)